MNKPLFSGLLLAAALLLPSLGAAQSVDKRKLEMNILHKRLSLSDVKVYARGKQQWQPLGRSTAKVRVVNLWAKSCAPCLAELPVFAKLVDDVKRRHGSAVQFLFIADPPEQTSADEVVAFWQRPWADALADKCPPTTGTAMEHDGVRSCLLKKLPEVEPARSDTDALKRQLDALDESRPVTLLLDEHGVVRQALWGAVIGSPAELQSAIDRLLGAVTGRPAGSAQ
jgi:thiol-disulfide isomerase/thioredoxin